LAAGVLNVVTYLNGLEFFREEIMKSVRGVVMGILGLAMLASCGKSEPVAEESQQEKCDLTGLWTSCSTDGVNSQRVVLNFGVASFDEDIIQYSGVTDCFGLASGSLSFSGTYDLGATGASTRIGGATDVSLIPTVDIVGCGASSPVYTSIKFSGDCAQFVPATGAPTCDPASSPTTLSTDVFVRQ
jgi:hypothetical protein